MKPWKEIQRVLVEQRKKRRLTQTEAGKMLGISRTYLSMLETGKADNPSYDLILRIMQVFGERKQGMKPLGYEDNSLEKDKVVEEPIASPRPPIRDVLEDHESEIAIPEDRYSVACINCAIEMHLQLLPHRDRDGLIVGWVFSCEKCRPAIIGRRMWWGEQEKACQH